MEITKRLYLNKTPKNVPNGSIVCAKNIITDNTASFITNEYGFTVAFECKNKGEFIVGCISCDVEVVVFTYSIAIDDITGEQTTTSRIYRLKDDGSYKEVNTNWKYSGGKITGTYAYNYKKELIIAICEYTDSEYNNKNIPLKCINLDANNSLAFSYATEEIIPNFTFSYDIQSSGSLACGVYTFFIRYCIDDNNFTKWFQITDDIIIIDYLNKEKPVHHFFKQDNESVNSVTIVNGKVNNNNNDVDFIFYNQDKISNKNILLTVNYDNEEIHFDKYQIGYIIKRKDEIVGRIKNTYNIGTNVINISDNVYLEEIEADAFLESPHQFYNVHNAINYNNRLYIANYKEYKNENLQFYADKITVKFNTEKVNSTIKTYKQTTVNVQFTLKETFTKNCIVSTYEKNGITYISNPSSFIYNNIASLITLTNDNGDVIPINKKAIIPVNDGTVMSIEQDFMIGINNSSDGTYYIPIFHTESNTETVDIIIENNKLVFVDKYYGNKYYIDGAANHNFGIYVHATYRLYPNISWQGHTGVFNQYYWVGSYEISQQPRPSYLSPGFYCDSNINVSSIIISSDDKTNNNYRSFVPAQLYNFFVHYIREDHSNTNGFFIDKIATTFDNNNVVNKDNPLIYAVFENIKIPRGYIGAFISYENVEKNSYPVVAIKYKANFTDEGHDDYSSNDIIAEVTNSAFIYNLESISGDKIADVYAKNSLNKGNSKIEEKRYNKKDTKEYSVDIALNYNSAYITYANTKGLYVVNTEPTENYNKTVKTLYRLTKNMYGKEGDILTNKNDNDKYMYVPGFYNREKVFSFNKELILDPASQNIINGDGEVIDDYNLKINTNYNWSHLPINAMSIDEDYDKGAVSMVTSQGKTKGVYYNKIVSPAKLPSLFKLESCYSAKPSKIYTNFKEDYTDIFTKTIYRSDVISDESLYNGFRVFQSNNYKNIQETKGDIVNLIGIGLYFIVHTTYSIFVFDRSNRLNSKAQLEIPDVFSIDYQDALPSNQGFGGIETKEESIITKHGYIWLDKANKIIFNYDAGKISIISKDIDNFLKSLDIVTVRFAEDTISDRLIICIYLNDIYFVDDEGNIVDAPNTSNEDITNTLTPYSKAKIHNFNFETFNAKAVNTDKTKVYARYKCITLSFNFNTNTFISLHDYCFTNSYSTYNNNYIINENNDRKRLYKFDKDSKDYYNLANHINVLYPLYK